MNIDLDTVERKADLKKRVIENIYELIENYKPEYHLELRIGMMRELELYKQDNTTTDLPIVSAIMRNTGMSKAQTGAFILALDTTIRNQLAGVIDKQFEELGKLGL